MATKTSSSSSSPSSWRKYDVIVSFRGEDTRLTFTDHLYKSLSHQGIYTYRDDKKLDGERIIVECKKELGLIVLPVFYHVEVEDVKEQTGEFGKAFAKHYKTDFQSEDEIRTVDKWREALTEVATSIEGWHIKERSETEVNEEIVKVVLKELNLTFSTSNNDLVGMTSRLEKMYSLLNISHLEVDLTVGIWGMGGIGKTTIAEHVKIEISNKYNACAFIPSVREEFEKNGIIHLQKLLCKYLLDHEGNIQHVEMERNVLRNRLGSRRVLIILDDVDELEQIEDLVGNAEQQHGWLGPGSRVIVTTRNSKAFKVNHPLDDFVNLSYNFVKYANGHPLALKVLGSFLFGADMDKWKATLNKFNELQIGNSIERNNGETTSKKNPEQKILPILQISFDGLDDDQKEIFLDIACFFKGEEEYLVKKILKGCGFHPRIDVELLIGKSLITMVGDKLWMHDLLQQFGQYIVHQEFPKEPGKRSRIWFHEDARNVLENNRGTEAVKGIFLGLPKNEELHLSVEPILKMKKLRLLKFQNVKFPECVGYLPNELRLLEWHAYPQKSMPSMSQLYLDGTAIKELPMSIEHLSSRSLLNLRDCKNLLKLPDELCSLTSLTTLNVSGCSHVAQLPENIGRLEQLKKFSASRTAISRAPPSIILLKSLKKPMFRRMLKNSNDQITVWTSDRGFTYIYYQDSENDGDFTTVEDMMDNIYNGEKTLRFKFMCTRIPEWCSQQNIGTSTRIQLPLENNDETWMGFAVFAVVRIQEDDFFHKDGKLEKAYFHFETDKGYLGNEDFVLDHHQIPRTGSYGVCIYVPQIEFAEQLNKAIFYLPMNLFDEKPWVGFCLYVLLTWSDNFSDSKSPLHLDLEWRVHGDDDNETHAIVATIPIKHKLILLNMPRVYVKAMLNQLRVVSAAFRMFIPDVEVEMCGIRLVNEQDVGNVIEMITDITLSSHHFMYDEIGSLEEYSSRQSNLVSQK
ncbi:disease resistance protein RUN1-like [Ziziphus jujuba]|uniref:ADP-ribosyl cyclase/cyclic ADP-ribose hydrolase n=1 Tax=Ziziphus jujuba TaxID=326968 RepID=A0ABM4AAZ0_ZIZJJ|nr:disease resistance protein RUN1-like [Ziziphus jujuba]